MQTQLEGPRPARPDEREAVLDLVNYVFRTSVGREPTIESDWPHVYDADNLNNVLVIADQGRLVASAAVWPNDIRIGDVVLRVGGINCVGTLPEYRRKGLGSRLMQATHARMAQLGCHVGLLSTGIANWYRSLGWERAGVVHTYRFDRANIGLLPSLPEGVRWRFAGEELAPVLCELHNADRLGAIRTPALFLRLLARRPSRLLVAERDGRPSAYVLLRNDQIFDWAGDAADLAGLIRACFEVLDDPNVSTSARGSEGQALGVQYMQVVTPAIGHPLISLLSQARIPVQVDYAGMLYVVAPAAILNAFGHAAIRVREEAASVELSHGESKILLNRNLLAKLLFGPEQVSPFGAEVFPLPFWQWGLEKV